MMMNLQHQGLLWDTGILGGNYLGIYIHKNPSSLVLKLCAFYINELRKNTSVFWNYALD